MNVKLLKDLNVLKKSVNDKKTLMDLLSISEDELNDALKSLNRRNQKMCRLRKYIRLLMLYTTEQYFITFDFTDSCLNEFKQDSRYQKVKRTLHSVCERYGGKYIANIDFSPTTKREHYHCILGLKKHVKYSELHDLIYNELKYKNYGCIDIIGVWNTDARRLARYINKLANHALKIDQNIIYSTGFESLDKFDKFRLKYTDIRNAFARSKDYEIITLDEMLDMCEN